MLLLLKMPPRKSIPKLVSSGVNFTQGGTSFTLVGHASSDAVTINIPYGVGRCFFTSTNNFSCWVG